MNATLHLKDYLALSPFFIVLAGGLGLILLEIFAEHFLKKLACPLAVVILAAGICAASFGRGSTNPLLTYWLRFDGLAEFFMILFLAIGIGTALLSYTFLQRFKAPQGEYYFLLLSALIGLMLIGSSADFLTLFLGIEILSTALYVMCGYMKKWTSSVESALKYFLLGSISAAVMLYGIALIYGAVGTTSFTGLLEAYRSIHFAPEKHLFMGGIALLTFGLAFKAAIVPFHFWAPDVYSGASTPVAAFMAVGVKAGAFAAFVRVFMEALADFNGIWNHAAAILVYPTLIYANFVAMRQVHLRRFFAYSGISHAGFLLIAIAAGTPEALNALIFYLVVYAVATLGAFAVLVALDVDSKGVMLEDLRGLFSRSPFMALVMSLCLLTLAGFPPTVGFFAKFALFKAAFHAGYYGVVIVGLLTTIFAAYYYFRMIAVMLQPSKEEAELEKFSLLRPEIALGCASFVCLIWISCFPSTLFFVRT